MPPVKTPFDAGLRASIEQRLRQHTVKLGTATGLKRAAVTVILADDGSGHASMILTRRASRLSSHAGQYALPGGRVDEGETENQAALREIREEIGLELQPEAILGRLDDYATRSGYLISPLVAWAEPGHVLTANPAEVAQIFHVPLGDLALPGSPQFVAIEQSNRPVIRYPLLGTLIHAPTAAVMYQFMEVAIFGRDTRVDHLEQALFAWR